MIRVAVVDDHAIVRRGLVELLDAQQDLEIVAEGSSGIQAIDIVRNLEPDVVLLDVSMPDKSGLEVMGHLLAKDPTLGIVVLSGYPEEHYALAVLRQGALGYLNKECEPDEIVSAIRTVAKGKRYINQKIAELLAETIDGKLGTAAPHTLLSDREMQVFLRLAKGESVGQIAETLNLSVKSVSTYRARTLEKLTLSTNSDLTYYALKNGLIS
jgi:DNA-binding NarL/FixJ family response regulator